MREHDDVALELRLRGVLREHLGALPLDVTVEDLEHRREIRDTARRRRRGLVALGLAAAFLVPLGVLAGGGRTLFEALVVPAPSATAPEPSVALAPSGMPDASPVPAPTPSALAPSPTASPIPGPRAYADEFGEGTPLMTPMSAPLLVPLLDGRVLILGNDSAEVYDTNTGSQKRIESLLASGFQSATRAADGRVLVIGLRPGVGNANEGLVTQVFDPRTDSFSAAGPMLTPRQDEIAVALADGRILIDGGRRSVDGPDIPLVAPEIFDPETSTFADAGFESSLSSVGTMTLLADGRVLITGGRGERFPNHTTQATGSRAAVLYDPATGSVARTGKPRHAPRFVLSGGDGGVLAVWDTGTREYGIDAWNPSSGMFTTIATTPSMFTQAVGLDDGRLLATSGYDTVLIDPSGALTALPARKAWIRRSPCLPTAAC